MARLHSIDLEIDPNPVFFELIQEPPELRLGTPVSRSLDIWCLACVYLEWITWLLMGSKSIATFADFRGEHPTFAIINNDFFYMIIEDPETKLEYAEIDQGVVTWIALLHQHQKCSQPIHDLLDLIMNKMLLVDSKERIAAVNLHRSLEELKKKRQGDDDYLLAPKPQPVVEYLTSVFAQISIY